MTDLKYSYVMKN